MKPKPLNHTEPETDREKTNRNELVKRIARATRSEDAAEPIKGLHLFRASSPRCPIHSVYKPAFCVIAQGSKTFFLNQERFVYDPNHYLLVTAELPYVGHVLEASWEQPYLSLRLDLEPALVGSVMAEVGDDSAKSRPNVMAVNVSALETDLLDATVRLVRLVETPAQASFLLPLIKREIIYRLWMGEQRDRLQHIVTSGGFTSDIAKAIELLSQDFEQPLRMDSIASELGISVSGFHHHFKAVTAMSPLQFQKRLRLQEARRLMLGEGLDATSTAFRVGYNDASHFSREYKSLFGLPPIRDVDRLRINTVVNSNTTTE